MNGHVTVGADTVQPEARRPLRGKAHVELRHGDVTAVAQLAHALMRKQMTIGTAMGNVTGQAAIDP